MRHWYDDVYTGFYSNLTEFSRGRNLRGGYARGTMLEFNKGLQLVREERLFREARRAAGSATITTDAKLANIYLMMLRPKPDPFSKGGHIVEFGSYKGGCAIFMAYIANELYPDIRIYAFDTFAGMPETDKGKDHHNKGDFNDNSLEKVQAAVNATGLKNIELVSGFFEDTAVTTLRKIGGVSLAHMDSDIYKSLITSYEAVKPHMLPGGYYVFDDPTFSSCIGAMEMVEDTLVVRDGMRAEQVYPHFVYRKPW